MRRWSAVPLALLLCALGLGTTAWARAPRRGLASFDPQVREVLASLPGVGPGQAVAAFDADHTLWAGDVGTGFCRHALREGLLPAANRTDLRRAWRAWRHGELDDIAMYKEMVRCMRGMKASEVRRLADTYFRRTLQAKVHAPMKALVKALRRRGVDVYVVSGSNSLVLERALAGFGIRRDHILGMDVKVKAGRLTDEFTRVTWREGKVHALEPVLNGRALVAGAGDSSGDLALLARVRPDGLRLMINPKPEVARVAREQGWLIQRLSRRSAAK